MQQRSDVVLLRGAALALVIVNLGVTADSTNNQDGSLNTNTVDSTVDSNNVSADNSTSNTYNGAGAGGDIPVTSAIAPSYITNGLGGCTTKSIPKCQGGARRQWSPSVVRDCKHNNWFSSA